ncbi:MAG TPA: glycoside hydrolase family 99-like domain-containing protein [Candidatus Brocadiia bacterium]|nr:glycoside hydrolase family 99-like domain-containing protein [Candidatus Brocadiia bacterium]
MKLNTACAIALLFAGCAWEATCDGERKDMKSAANPNAQTHDIRVTSFLPSQPVCRAKRPARITAILQNRGENDFNVAARIALPESVRLIGPGAEISVSIKSASESEIAWEVEALEPGECELSLSILPASGAKAVAETSLKILFLSEVTQKKLEYIPEPQPVKTRLLIGAHHCPLWEADKPQMWNNIIKHPERTPALGFYSQENPEVSDWETKWATEHGVSFFIYCWYRSSQGGPVTMNFGSAIHDALFKSRFKDKMKFTIMWENQSKGTSGVSGEKDLKENLFPFWMENYFKFPGYLKVDNRPVLFIYRPEFLIQDLGSVENVVKAFDWMREESKRHGFDGLYILGEYRGLDAKHLRLMKSLGLDYSFAYCWHVPNSPTPEVAINTQLDYIRKTQELGILPQVVTVSQAWSGWNDEGSIWKIPPTDFERLLKEAGDFVATLPKEQLGSRMLLLDNWNEWGEGHYIAPYREYGFGYLDAVRKVFSDAPEAHEDLIPEDIGMGPYDKAYRETMRREKELRELGSKQVFKTGAPEKGLVAWWAFDEKDDSPVALDYSGHRMGGQLIKAKRNKGVEGSALVCDGGCVVVANNPLLTIEKEITISCWVKTDVAGQGNTWFVNRIFSGGTATGYRMGVLDGKACFEIPVSDWSHHLSASDPLPTGRWVHLAGTFDGKIMRIYVDGVERGTMERPGPINPNPFKLCLGSFEVGHAAHFIGLLDEVKLYDRALSAEEVKQRAKKPAGAGG